MIRTRFPKRTAFTLIELLVVIAIIAVLVGLLLPAVQKVREAAARMSCSNNLKQLALAMQNYHSSFNAFPYGAADDRKNPADGNVASSLPWGVYLLPYIEQGNLYNRFHVASISGTNGSQLLNGQVPGTDPTLLWNNPPNNTNVADPTLNPAANKVKTYICPSSPSNGAVYQDTWDNDAYGAYSFSTATTSWTVSASDYFGFGGVLGSLVGNQAPDLAALGIPHDGVFSDNRNFTIQSITDGTSNTVCIGEMAGAPNVYVASPKQYGSPPYDDNATNFYISGNAWADETNGDQWLGGSTFDGGVALGNPVTGGPCVVNCVNIAQVFAFHTGGANVAFCDGHVQFISQTVTPRTLILLLVPNDGQVINSNSF